MKIIDNFLFRNEYDILEIRLSILYEHVDQFTIVESDHTFTGKYKGYNLLEHKERYKAWWDKINYVKIGKSPHDNTWATEHWNRNHFYSTWKNLTDADVVMISDADEIIRPEAVEFIKNTNYNFYRLGMPFFNFKFNYFNVKGHTPWPSAKAFRGYFIDGNDGMRGIQHAPNGKNIMLDHCGWHFSYLGDRDWIIEKLQSYAHTESNTPSVIDNLQIDRLIKEGKDFASRPGMEFKVVKLDEYFPKPLIDNKEKFKDLILPDSDLSVLDIVPGPIPKQV